MMGWYGAGMGVGSWLAMGVFWLVLLAAVIWLVAQLLPTSQGRAGGRAAQPESPEDILDRRFTLGELDTQTYQAQRAALVAARAGHR